MGDAAVKSKAPMFRKLLPFFLLSCSGLSFAATLNIVLITLDTTRADRMGFLGSRRGLTPNLDLLAKGSVVFTRAYAQVPLTTPSHAALLTGTYPQYNHVEDLGAPLGKDLPYLPDLLHQKGYRTAAFVGAYILDPKGTARGFERGFDLYDADFHHRKPGEDRYRTIERRAGDVENRALAWLTIHGQAPFFIWLHFYDPHDPYDPPEPFKTKYASVPYDGEIAYTDSIVGNFVKALREQGLYQNTLIAIAADHGEAFGEHGEERHGMFLYDETTHVPLVMKLPAGRSAGRRVEERVALADIAPSLLEAAGITAPTTMQSQSLFPLMVTEKSAINKGTASGRAIYSETNYGHRAFGWAALRSWREGKYLYVQAPKRELYDQLSDAGALNNLATSSKPVADTLNSQVEEFQKIVSSTPSPQSKMDPSQAENLRALGYLAVDSQSNDSNTKAEVDPKDRIDIANKFHRALISLEEDRYDDAIAELRELVRLAPDMSVGYLELGRSLLHGKDYREALPVLRVAVEKMPESGMAHFELGLGLVKTEQWDAALSEMQAATLRAPNSAQLHFSVGAIQLRLKRLPDATFEFEKALEIAPDHFLTNLKYGEMLLVLEGNPSAALPRLSKAVKVDETSGEARRFLAEAYSEISQQRNPGLDRDKADVKPPAPE
jgi:arylsulfatase A-like enzyme